MNWYGGNIAEAVQRSKQEGAVFFVAIFGEDEPSQRLEEAVNSSEITALLSSSKYVCIKLVAQSQEHLQFKQIYSNAESPCLYFISLMGAPVEIVHGEGETSIEQLQERCESAWSKHSKVLQCQKTPVPPQAQKTGSGGAASSVPESSSATPGGSAGAASSAAAAQEISDGEDVTDGNLSLEQKIERARKLAAAKAQLKVEEEAEEARRREKERREAGKGMAELKRWQEDEESKRLVEERKREKREEQALRQRLREQIAQDRAERNKRTNASIAYDGAEPGPSSGSGAQKPGFTASTPVNYEGKARLQFRLPDGSSQSHTFEQDATLGHVRQYLIEGQHVKFSNFGLCVAFPRREFTSAEYTSTLKELGLLPSSALLVIPAGGNVLGAARGNGGVGIWAWITTLITYLLYPVTFLFGMVQQALPSSGSTSGRPSSNTPPNRGENRLGGSESGNARPGNTSTARDATGTASASPGSSNDARKRNVKQERSADGNIHRLRNQETDSDDELGTWNGNSTQQKPR